MSFSSPLARRRENVTKDITTQVRVDFTFSRFVQLSFHFTDCSSSILVTQKILLNKDIYYIEFLYFKTSSCRESTKNCLILVQKQEYFLTKLIMRNIDDKGKIQGLYK